MLLIFISHCSSVTNLGNSNFLNYKQNKESIDRLLQSIVNSFIDNQGGNEAHATKTIETIHAEHLFKKGFERFEEPITKLLDEINYFI